MSSDPVVEGIRASENYLKALDDWIKAQILQSWPDKIPGIDSLARHIESELAKVEGTLKQAENAVKTQIEPLIARALPNPIEILTSFTRSLDTHIAQLVNNIATTEDVVGTAIGQIRHHAPEFARWLTTQLAGGLGGGILTAFETMEHQGTEGIDLMLDEILKLPNVPHWFSTMTHGFRHREAEWQALALPALIVGVIIGAVEAMQEPIQVAIRQGAFEKLPTKEAEPPTLVEAMIRRTLTDDHFYHAMRQNGYEKDIANLMLGNRETLLDPETITRLFLRGNVDQATWENELLKRGYDTERARFQWLSSLTLLPENDIRDAFLRGIFTAEQHDHALRQYGYTDERAAMKRRLYFFIPPAQDLIHMAIRNVFNDEIVKRFELFGDFPEPFKTAAAQQGISEQWALRYWGAHWIVPSNTEGFEMFQRTTDKELDENADFIELSDGTKVRNIIGGSTLRLLLREKDIAPFYRDKLTELAYRPLTRIDIRRLHKTGLLTKAHVERAYLDLGYKPLNARLLAEFTEKLNATTTKDQATSLVQGIRHKVVQLYIADKLSFEQVKSTLTDLGFTEGEVVAFTTEADLVHKAEHITAEENGIGKLYVQGFIDDKDATKRLQAIGVPVNAMAHLFYHWDLERELLADKAHIHKHRELTKSEVLEAFTDGMLDEPTAVTMLNNLGYDDNGAEAEIGLALFKQAKAAKRTQIDAIKALFVNGIAQELETSNRLDALRVPSEQRDAYLAEWALARETRTERIPIATLRDMVRNKYLTTDQILPHLRRHRLTDLDAQTLVNFWAGQTAPVGV